MSIGDRIKFEREKKGISQTDLAKAISVSKQTLYKYENNIITNIPSDKIEKLSQILDITPTYIMGWNDDFYLGENLQHIFNILSAEFNCPANKLIRCFFTEDFSNLLPSKRVISLDNMRQALKQYKDKYSLEDIELSSTEGEHIKKYRSLDAHGKDMVDTVLIKEYNRCEADKKENVIPIAKEPLPEHLIVQAAHNDSVIDGEELEKMQRDIELLKSYRK